MNFENDKYQPFPPSLKLIASGEGFVLKCATVIPADTCLGITSVYVSPEVTSLRTPLGAFLEKSSHGYNCCVRSADLKTYHLWTLRSINAGETITTW